MKDAELRELFASLRAALNAIDAAITAGATSPISLRQEMRERLTRIQELAEAGRHFEARNDPLPPWIPACIGLFVGALVFALGILGGWVMFK